MVIIYLLPLICFTQNSILNEVYNKNTRIACSANAIKTLSFKGGNLLYFFDAYSPYSSSNLIIHVYNLKTDEKESDISITIPKEFKKLIGTTIFSFIICNNKLVLLTDANIYVAEISNYVGKIISFTPNRKAAFNKIKILNEKEILLYVYYNFHPLDALEKHVWAKFNLITNKIEFIKKFDDKEAVFTHFFNEWVSTYKGVIIQCNTVKYCVKFYNSEFKLFDSLTSNYFDENKEYLSLFKNNLSSKDEIVEINKKDDSLLKRIQKIYLIDSNTVLISVKLPRNKNLELHLWQKINSAWQQIKSESLLSFYDEGNTYNNSNNSINPFIGNLASVEYNNDKYVYQIYPVFIPNVVTSTFNLKTDYIDRTNELVKKNNLYYGIKKYKVNY